jgi:pimeloyl-ACP methyl ester carboxylesterase
LMAASVGEAFAASLGGHPAPAETAAAQPVWTTPHRVRLEIGTMELRDFSTGECGVPVLICAPYALHCATIADFARGHSVVEALRDGGVSRIHVTDWRSAGPDMRFLSIDNYLADLNVAVDEIGAPVDLIGLCQGGWMALTYAARFPHKVRRLVLAGAPVDIGAGQSNLSQMTIQVPLAAFEEFVGSQGGRVLGQRVLQIWGTALIADDARRVLQLPPDDNSMQMRELEAFQGLVRPDRRLARRLLSPGGVVALPAEPARHRQLRRSGPADRSFRPAPPDLPARRPRRRDRRPRAAVCDREPGRHAEGGDRNGNGIVRASRPVPRRRDDQEHLAADCALAWRGA